MKIFLNPTFFTNTKEESLQNVEFTTDVVLKKLLKPLE